MSDDTKIVDLRERVRAKEEQAKLPTTADSDGPTPKIYTVVLMDDTELQGFGILMVNSYFFAVGLPTEDGNGVDFSLAVPINNVKFVEAEEIEDEATA